MIILDVDGLYGITDSLQEPLFEAMRTCSNPQRLAVCLFFMSDLPDNEHTLSAIERNLVKIFPPSLTSGLTPEQYTDFGASVIRFHFNSETTAVNSGELAEEERLWHHIGTGLWRNTRLGNQYALDILRERGLSIGAGFQAPSAPVTATRLPAQRQYVQHAVGAKALSGQPPNARRTRRKKPPGARQAQSPEDTYLMDESMDEAKLRTLLVSAAGQLIAARNGAKHLANAALGRDRFADAQVYVDLAQHLSGILASVQETVDSMHLPNVDTAAKATKRRSRRRRKSVQDERPPGADPIELEMTISGVVAQARYFNRHRIVVLAGSTIVRRTHESLIARDIERREEVDRQGLLLYRDSDALDLLGDVAFDSVSGAAKFVSGSSVSGMDYWKCPSTGRSLKELLASD